MNINDFAAVLLKSVEGLEDVCSASLIEGSPGTIGVELNDGQMFFVETQAA